VGGVQGQVASELFANLVGARADRGVEEVGALRRDRIPRLAFHELAAVGAGRLSNELIADVRRGKSIPGLIALVGRRLIQVRRSVPSPRRVPGFVHHHRGETNGVDQMLPTRASAPMRVVPLPLLAMAARWPAPPTLARSPTLTQSAPYRSA